MPDQAKPLTPEQYSELQAHSMRRYDEVGDDADYRIARMSPNIIASITELQAELARLRADRKTLDAISDAAGGESVMDLIAAELEEAKS